MGTPATSGARGELVFEGACELDRPRRAEAGGRWRGARPCPQTRHGAELLAKLQAGLPERAVDPMAVRRRRLRR
eukprot:409109-Pyramimonas_sp.AAC.1